MFVGYTALVDVTRNVREAFAAAELVNLARNRREACIGLLGMAHGQVACHGTVHDELIVECRQVERARRERDRRILEEAPLRWAEAVEELEGGPQGQQDADEVEEEVKVCDVRSALLPTSSRKQRYLSALSCPP